jgi:hypothetical protein
MLDERGSSGGWGRGQLQESVKTIKPPPYRSLRSGRFAARLEVCCTGQRPLLDEPRKRYAQFEFFRF